MFTAQFFVMLVTCTALTIGITEALKQKLQVAGRIAIFFSLVVSAVVCFVHCNTGGFEWYPYISLTAATFLQANGIYLFSREMVAKMGKQRR